MTSPGREGPGFLSTDPITPTEDFSALDSRNSRFDPGLVIAEVDAIWIGRFVHVRHVRTVERIDRSIRKFVALHCSVLIDDLLKGQQTLAEKTNPIQIHSH